MKLKLRKMGNSVGAIIPKKALAKMNAAEGDTLYLSETPDGYKITPNEPSFGILTNSAERVMKKYRNTLRELAK